MATHVVRTDWPQAAHAPGIRPGVRALHFLTRHYLLLPLGAAIALVWVNIDPFSYFTVAQALAFPVNEIAIALFFGLVAQEVYEEMYTGGALHQWRRWTVPLIAAVSGLAVAAAVYGSYVEWKLETMLHVTWPVVAGVDIAMVYLVVKGVFHRPGPHRSGRATHPALPFALSLALATNVIGIVMIAPTYFVAAERTGGSAVVMAAALATAWWLRRQHIGEFWPYIWIAGGLSWLALYLQGFHPALALLPIVPFLPHARRRRDEFFADERRVRGESPRHFEHVWHYHAQAALFLFGLVNAGVVLTGYGAGTWATLAALLIGRTAGIMLGVGLAVLVGLQLPAHLRARDLVVVAVAASAGFTFSLFFATTLLPAGPLLAELKLGALLSASGALVALGLARLLRVGRFAARERVHAEGKHRGA